jgi:branched-chain amino acid transport system ATP-binding protein
MTAPLLRLIDVAAGHGGGNAVEGVSLDLAPGTVLALLGANGAGKSTLLDAAIGLVPLARGEIYLAGEAIGRLPPQRRARLGLGYVPQGRRVFPGLTVRENLDMAAFAGARERGRRFERVIGLFPALAEAAGRRAWQLSGGQQQMLAIGRALMAEPRALLLDEPSQGLAPALIEALFPAICALAAGGVAILLAEQNAAAALAIADTAALMAGGRILRYGEAALLREAPILRDTLMGIA